MVVQSMSKDLQVNKKGYYVCPYCKSTFTNYDDFLYHQINNLWERHLHKRRGRPVYYCDICNEEFYRIQDYIDHWDDYHDNYAASLYYTRKSAKTNTEFFKNRPTESALLYNRIKRLRHLRALKYNESAYDYLLEEIRYGPPHRSNTISVINGIPGMGKSSVALALASLYQQVWYKYLRDLYNKDKNKFKRITGKDEFYVPKVYIGFSVAHTVELIKNARAGDTIIQDEDPSLSGADSRIVGGQLKNIQNILRQSAINLIFVTPFDISYITIPNYKLEVVGRNDEKRQNLCIYYDRKNEAIGWVIVEILPEDHPFMLKYEKLKMSYVNNIVTSGGGEIVGLDMDKLSGYVSEVLEFIKVKVLSGELIFKNNRMFAEIVVNTYFGNKVVGKMKEYITYLVRANLDTLEREIMMEREKEREKEESGKIKKSIELAEKYDFISVSKKQNAHVSIKGYKLFEIDKEVHDGFVYELVENYLDDETDKYLMEFSKVHDEVYKELSEKNFFKNYRPEYFNYWFDYYYNKMSIMEIADQYGIIRSKIGGSGGYKSIVNKEISGYLFEKVVKNLIFPTFEQRGGFHEPDLISPDGKEWVEVKIRTRDGRRDRMLFKEFVDDFELRAVRDDGITLYIVLFQLRQKKKQLQVWKVTYDAEAEEGVFYKGEKVGYLS